MKIDMPGTQKGVDLRFDKSTPMNWKEYASRVKGNGAAIRKGDTVRITAFVVKKDMIEFQLDGGGFGTFRDDATTTVTAKTVEKSNYEKDLERQIADTTDEDRKRSLQRDLDRERARRARQDADNQREAQIASQMKAEKVMEDRLRGGSRFNLRWAGSVPSDITPEAVMTLLAEYVDFNAMQEQRQPPPALQAASDRQPAPGDEPAGSPTAQLKRGMTLDQVAKLLGHGQLISESTSNDGLKTQVYEYVTGDRRAEVTYVDGVVVRFAISSR